MTLPEEVFSSIPLALTSGKAKRRIVVQGAHVPSMLPNLIMGSRKGSLAPSKRHLDCSLSNVERPVRRRNALNIGQNKGRLTPSKRLRTFSPSDDERPPRRRNALNISQYKGRLTPSKRHRTFSPSDDERPPRQRNALTPSKRNRTFSPSGDERPAYSGLTNRQSSYPINPAANLKILPFYDILGELLKTTLAPSGSGFYQEAGFSFSLTPQQANKMAKSRHQRPGKQDYTVQLQMRFCLLKTNCEQEDKFPPNIAVKVNEKVIPLPRNSGPINITALCRMSSTVTNHINVSWAPEYGRCYVISVHLVQKLSSDDLLNRLKNKGEINAGFTRSLIKQKVQEDADCGIATSLRYSLQCPLGQMRMMLPARAITCNHLQCFDASVFLQMNERKPTWTCPICDTQATYENLLIDDYFRDVIQETDNCLEVTLDKTGEWTPLIPEKEPKEVVMKRKPEVQCETLISNSDDYSNDGDASIVEESSQKKFNNPVVFDCITLTDSEDEDGPPPAKRPKNAQYMSSVSIAEDAALVVLECITLTDSEDEDGPPPAKRLKFTEV